MKAIKAQIPGLRKTDRANMEKKIRQILSMDRRMDRPTDRALNLKHRHSDDKFSWEEMLTHEEFNRMSQMVDKIVGDD